MSSVTITKDTPQTAAVSNHTHFPTNYPTARGPERSLAGLAYPDAVRVRLAEGWATVPLYVASYRDGVRIVWCDAAGATARITDYGAAGYAIEIKASDTPSSYHSVSAQDGCDCREYAKHSTCPHCGAGRVAEQVYSTWRYAERVRSTNARRAAAGKMALSQYQWEGVA